MQQVSKSANKIWVNGEIVESSNAMIPLLSPTAQHGLNVFEGIRCYRNATSDDLFSFRLFEHLQRLDESCKIIGLTPSYTHMEIVDAIKLICRENDFKGDVSLRITYFVGGQGGWQNSDPVGLFIAPVQKDRNRLQGIQGKKARVSSWRRISDISFPPRIKCGANYINGRYAQLEAVRSGYDLPILLDDRGNVTESPGACVMIVRKGVLVTPPITSSILESITRETLLTIAEENNINTQQREINRSELYLSDEVFLCGSAAEITPIASIDDINIEIFSGKVTSMLSEEYFNIADGSSCNHVDWLTKVG